MTKGLPKRMRALEQTVREFVDTPYTDVRNQLAGWRETFSLLLDEEAYGDLKKALRSARRTKSLPCDKIRTSK